MHEHLDNQQIHASAHRPPVARRASDHAQLSNAALDRVLGTTKVQRAGATSAQQLDESVARAIEQRRGHGRPLDQSARENMEASLGHDLSSVRVHDDQAADELNRAVSARAFTTGNDVFFKQGAFNQGSSSGRELLAHELTHVVQQRTGTSGLGPGEVSHPSDTAEQHAAEVGRLMLGDGGSDHSSVAATDSGPAVSRQAVPDDELDEMEEGVAGSWEPGTAQREVNQSWKLGDD